MYKLTHKEYFDALKNDRLKGLKCLDCGSYTVPPKASCDSCASMNVEAAELSGEGEIRTFTVSRVAPMGMEAPYIVAMVELAEGPWLMGNIDGVDPDKASIELIGKKVALGHKVVTELDYTGEEGGVSPVFSLK